MEFSLWPKGKCHCSVFLHSTSKIQSSHCHIPWHFGCWVHARPKQSSGCTTWMFSQLRARSVQSERWWKVTHKSCADLYAYHTTASIISLVQLYLSVSCCLSKELKHLCRHGLISLPWKLNWLTFFIPMILRACPMHLFLHTNILNLFRMKSASSTLISPVTASVTRQNFQFFHSPPTESPEVSAFSMKFSFHSLLIILNKSNCSWLASS